MDPKTLPTLDPKLKEAYERVMGSSVTPPPPVQPQPVPAAPQPPPPAPAKSDVASATSDVALAGGSSVHHTTTSFVAGNVAGNVEAAGKPKISPLVLVFAGVIFLLVYTLFWMRFFNLPLPFLSQ